MTQGSDNHRRNPSWSRILDAYAYNLPHMLGFNTDITFLSMTCHDSFVRFFHHSEAVRDNFYDQKLAKVEEERRKKDRLQYQQQLRAMRRFFDLPSPDSDSYGASHSDFDEYV